MTLWRWAAVAAIPFLLIALSFGRIAGIDACHPPGEPILLFELVTSPGQVAALFPPHCAAAATAAQVSGLRIDNFAFIPVYSAFLLLVLAALRRDGRFPRSLFRLGLALVLTAVVADYWENSRLAAILASLPGTQADVAALIPAPRIKFAALALAELLAAGMLWRGGGWRRWIALPAGFGGLLSLAGLVANRAWILPGGTLAYLALILVAWTAALRRRTTY